MKVSAFTFIKNGELLGYPFLQSINSILPIVDEFVINVGKSEDNTLDLIKSIPSSKIRIIESIWNNQMQDQGVRMETRNICNPRKRVCLIAFLGKCRKMRQSRGIR